MIVRGHVLVNDQRSKKGDLLSSGDQVEVHPFTEPDDRKIEPNPTIQFVVQHAFEHYVVIEKPAYLATHPNQFDDHRTLANGLVARFPEMLDVGEDSLRPGIVHRLDSNTSGIMLAARTQEGFEKIRNLFNERQIHKTYHALVLGKIKNPGKVELDIAHHPKNPRKMIALKEKDVNFRSRRRNAKTIYEPIKSLDGYTLVSVQTLTGRMHQVRVHLGAIGHPLVGDPLYQSPKERNLDQLGLTRHFLHAVKLEFTDPWDQTPKTFESNLSNDLVSILQGLK